MLTAKMATDTFDRDKIAMRMAKISSWLTLTIVIVPLITLAFVFFYVRFTDVSGFYAPMIVPFLLPLCLALIIGSLLHLFGKHLPAFMSFSVLTFVSYMILINALSVYYPKINPISRFSEKINKTARPGDVVCQYRGTDAHFMIYYSNNDVVLIRDKDKMKSLLSSDKKVYCVIEGQNYSEELLKELSGRTKLLDSSAQYSLITN